MQTATEKKPSAATANTRRWRKQSEAQGIPAFALRLLANRRFREHRAEPILRYRHD